MVTDMMDLKRHRATCNGCKRGAYCHQERCLEDLEYIAKRKAAGDWPWDERGRFIGHGDNCERCNRSAQ